MKFRAQPHAQQAVLDNHRLSPAAPARNGRHALFRSLSDAKHCYNLTLCCIHYGNPSCRSPQGLAVLRSVAYEVASTRASPAALLSEHSRGAALNTPGMQPAGALDARRLCGQHLTCELRSRALAAASGWQRVWSSLNSSYPHVQAACTRQRARL